jgi:hypothetical protein
VSACVRPLTGIATPTVPISAVGVIAAASVSFGVSVVKFAVSGVVLPSALTAVPETVYPVSRASGAVEVHEVLSGDISPGSALPSAAVTPAALRVPPVAATVTGVSGRTSTASAATFTAIPAGFKGSAVCVTDPLVLLPPADTPPFWQAVSTPSTSTAPSATRPVDQIGARP